MRVPENKIKDKADTIEKILGEKLRTCGIGEDKKYVFRKDQIMRLSKFFECNDSTVNTIQISEASGLVQRSFMSIIGNGSGAKSTPAGKMALTSAILSLYAVDPGMASGLTYLLD